MTWPPSPGPAAAGLWLAALPRRVLTEPASLLFTATSSTEASRTARDAVAAPYQISSRTQMQPDIDYALCHDNRSQVCTVEEASATGSTAGSDTSGP